MHELEAIFVFVIFLDRLVSGHMHARELAELRRAVTESVQSNNNVGVVLSAIQKMQRLEKRLEKLFPELKEDA